METALPSPPSLPPFSSKNKSKKERKKLPSPREMIAHYESKGMETQEASLKVIEDLQSALFRKFVLDNNNKKSAGAGETTVGVSSGRKLDVINSRLMNLDMKVDMKPGYPQTLAIGIASGAVLKGIGAVVPHLASSVAHLWSTVSNFTTSELFSAKRSTDISKRNGKTFEDPLLTSSWETRLKCWAQQLRNSLMQEHPLT